jgi:hypothetical protein
VVRVWTGAPQESILQVRHQGILCSLPAGAIGVEAPGIALFRVPVGTAGPALIP